MSFTETTVAWVNSTHSLLSKTNVYILCLILFGAYLILVRSLRYKYINNLRKQYPDPQVVFEDYDAAEAIFSHAFRREFPIISRESLEFALFKTFVVPSISKTLVASTIFEKDCAKRADDTELILGEIADPYPRIQNHMKICPFISEMDIMNQRGRATQAINRLNDIHAKHNIRNDDHIYTVGLFVAEPIRWIAQFEWRELDEREINAMFVIWADLGKKMKIKDIPATPQELTAFRQHYEKTVVRYSKSNWKCAQHTIDHLLSRIPKLFWPIVYKIIPCVLDEHDIVAFGIEPPSPIFKTIFWYTMRLRANFIRYLCLPRTDFVIRTPYSPNAQGRFTPVYDVYKSIYTTGYNIFELGHIKGESASKCPMSR
ncbi:hypothetical protein J3Q64DRAFT_1778539 [Phycomyces blakesleeanus]|uniref:ER-bound oxygenase mpaB/mpaB'/Rubber oxygenase catalytic domain-containing protein n=2 Tax=Phycomyces blakesleeanus TaxID=4837 RepID=A0A162TVA4_PHYB8|nr:hypothetical protein PHYBLDRAFT_171500 [Phycomyces blakesleeanus NRRL 1555(-)]XP_018291164.1 hypothetical protein PHYBLDRAFT_146437 [Phycomyces blakesleeanus NRRL 1555(-)]OAD70113.1 hypothetical protein PHYBLDRAFT_171500 [Phycomyces blakesleeanus NRRL 1555(-)]OAD73124.1 hypothetical protein PHYBLDRAFT_146437 [Phycomyces blakesleeanus NRRL 1555(-)]|eukprot:XP_018288153.1 hypothetical protein PHYBLDRAFT_171500 [Phycomyces blakesleeanus NRRL 1555(-)]